ncbi:DUF3649 domain-containing protein [Pseudomonas schmalbachii]|uniref:DUF3649 domain-containing protein n=1 Tax=Pseudomonas schmalbachii TaxID=2816993 RepID=A0ABS3TQD6_9PSED|nr:DUF3649 domain-containing protein [Pseudomonas schmalbachii]MBO3274784.1 DUF3649 domain-containing protein [Pseudomonas schmalbachii]
MSDKGKMSAAALTSRILAALFGGYALAYSATAFLSVYLPLGRADRVAFASLLCFAVWVAAIVFVFATRSAWRAWCGPLLLSVLLALAAFLPGTFGARP